tara:strand:+ start:2049 stop:2252 length:204 start_codon:yes stop_codon:yes gene_type:complete
MENKHLIKVGSLVVDANPYKAPELFYGYGIVLEVISEFYVIVHWDKYNFTQAVRISDLEVLDEIEDR